MEKVGQIVFQGHVLDVHNSVEEPLFLATAVAKLIDYSVGNTWRMLEIIDADEKLLLQIVGSGQHQQRRKVWFLTEDGLYEVLMQSRKPVAKQFKSVIKHILKSLRYGRHDITGWFEHLDSIAYELEFEENYDLLTGDYIDGYWSRKGEQEADGA